MKHIGNELNRILSEKRNLKKKQFADILGMSDVNLSKLLKKSTIQSDLLEKISRTLKLPITFWFDEATHPSIHQNGNGNKTQFGNGNVIVESQANEIEHLKQIIEEKNILLIEKDALIAEKERTIQILISK